MTFKPMLAATIEDVEKIQFPVFASPKLDGIRCVVIDGVATSRSLKPIPNKHIQSILGYERFNGLDGELIVGEPTHEQCYRQTTSFVMSEDKVGDFTFYVFDNASEYSADQTFQSRLTAVSLYLMDSDNKSPHVKMLAHELINTLEELLEYEAKMLALGYEGVMIRSIDGGYKHGRSTLKDRILAKLKRFTDAEGKVKGFIEQMENQNEKKTNELGRSQRSSHQENKVGKNTLGVLLVDFDGVEVRIGSGFTHKEAQWIWNNQAECLGSIVKFKHFTIGGYDNIRHGVYLGFRDPIDMG